MLHAWLLFYLQIWGILQSTLGFRFAEEKKLFLEAVICSLSCSR